VPARLDRVDWHDVAASLDARGHATLPGVLDTAECAALRALWDDEGRFRTRIDMARYRFGVGEYRYFGAPLPAVAAALRTELYRRFVPIANEWMARLGEAERYPPRLAQYLARCAAQGQRRPTPLLLRYGAGGYNCLHQDLYGALAFPLQFTCVLSERGQDYSGGEILLVEQRPRAQSRGEVVVLGRGDAVVFPNRHRPIAGGRGWYRVTVRHGVSSIHSGARMSLGVIFHDAA